MLALTEKAIFGKNEIGSISSKGFMDMSYICTYVFDSFIADNQPGLPDGIFSYQKSQFGYTLEGFRM
jgi:hypothetical protein